MMYATVRPAGRDQAARAWELTARDQFPVDGRPEALRAHCEISLTVLANARMHPPGRDVSLPPRGPKAHP